MYNIDEIDDQHVDVHQDEYCSDTERTVVEGTTDADFICVREKLDGEATAIEASLENLISDKQVVLPENYNDEEEDDNKMQQGTDKDNADDSSEDEHDDQQLLTVNQTLFLMSS